MNGTLADESEFKESSVDKPVLPDWLSRGGAPEAVEVGANLRDRYDKLKVSAGAKCDEVRAISIAVSVWEPTPECKLMLSSVSHHM